ncbi:MYO5B protein, partial [Crypturellus undulatus]|nr:MYO5B protein [Crypturellus undulatus]
LQVLRQLLFFINGTTLNYLLLRKDACSWSRGIQLRWVGRTGRGACGVVREDLTRRPCPHGRYNISQLEQWLRAEGLHQSGVREELEPLVQAAQLLQVKKATEEDAGAICTLCTVLSPQQVVRILRAYTPAAGLEERVSPGFISRVESRLQQQSPAGPGQLFVDVSHLFPVHLPFCASSVHLDELRIPESLGLPFPPHV